MSAIQCHLTKYFFPVSITSLNVVGKSPTLPGFECVSKYIVLCHSFCSVYWQTVSWEHLMEQIVFFKCMSSAENTRSKLPSKQSDNSKTKSQGFLLATKPFSDSWKRNRTNGRVKSQSVTKSYCILHMPCNPLQSSQKSSSGRKPASEAVSS